MNGNHLDAADLRTIVLVHGLWMTPLSWEEWIDRYQDHGHRVLAPAWPGMEGEIEQLRRDPSPIARLNVTEIVDHYDRIIRELERPPIIMGHCFGGTFVQLLLDRGLGAAGVVIDSSPVRGVFRMPLAALRSAWPILRNPLLRHRAVPLTARQFNYAFANTLSASDSDEVYRLHHVPAPRNVLLEGINANLNPWTTVQVDFRKNDRAPLLFIAGGVDHVVPAAVNKENAARYHRSLAVTAYKEFPGRSHYILGQDGWDEVADYALDWALQQTAKQAAKQSGTHLQPLAGNGTGPGVHV